MATVRITPKARAELNEMRAYLLRSTDRDFTAKTMNRIRAELQRLADTEMLDREDIRLSSPLMRWYWLLDAQFVVYYERRAGGIRIARIWPAKREPLDPGSI